MRGARGVKVVEREMGKGQEKRREWADVKEERGEGRERAVVQVELVVKVVGKEVTVVRKKARAGQGDRAVVQVRLAVMMVKVVRRVGKAVRKGQGEKK